MKDGCRRAIGEWLKRSGRGGVLVEVFVVFGLPLMCLRVALGLVGGGAMLRESMVAVAVLMMAVLIWLGVRLRGEGASELGMRIGGVTLRSMLGAAWKGLVVGVFALVAFVAAGALASSILPEVGGVEPGGFDGLQGNPAMLVGMLVVVWVTSSFGEEVIYRGYLMRRLAAFFGGGKLGWGVGLVLSSVGFGLAHWDWGIAGVVQTGGMGFALGVGYLCFGRNLWIAVLAHGILDTLLLVSLYFGG